MTTTSKYQKALRHFSVALFLLFAIAIHPQNDEPQEQLRLIIDANETREPISKYLYGQFIEHQGRCIYGGIWAEMIKDRKFLYPINFYFPWGERKHQSPWRPLGFDTIVTMDREHSFAGEHTPRIDLDGVKPRGIEQAKLALEKGQGYEGRIILAGDPSVTVEVSLAWGPGKSERQTITISKLQEDYKKWPLHFTAGTATINGRLRIVGYGEGRLSIGAVSLMPADNIEGMRADTIALLKELDATVYRWPGGNFVSTYDWRDGIGERDRRPPRRNHAYWSEDVESNDFGLDEFMTFCRVIDTDPYMVVNAGTGDEYSAAAEVEYLNGSPETRMGKRRAENGHPEPYNVRFWGIGNEMWQPDYLPLHLYVERHNRFAEKMREVDPSIVLVGVGGLGVNEEWTPTMLRECGEHMDLIGEHMYAEGPAATIAEGVERMRGGIAHHAQQHRELQMHREERREKIIPIALDEWNNFWYSPQIYGEAAPRYYLREALNIAGGLHELYRNTDMIYMANTHPVNVHGHIKTTDTNAAFEITGLILKMYREHFGEIPVEVRGERGILDVTAAWTEERDILTVGTINPSERPHRLILEINGAQLDGTARAWIVSNDDPMVYNEPGFAPRVEIVERHVDNVNDGITLPPYSAGVWRLPVR